MNELFGMLVRFLRSFHFWIFVAPWEKAIRVRCGKHVRTLNPGFHLKFPLIDRVFLQSDRMRIASAGKQTLTTKDLKVVTLTASIGYHIADIELLYRTLHHAEDTVTQLVKSLISEKVSLSSSLDLSIAIICSALGKDALQHYGIGGATLYVTDLAIAEPLRIIGDYSEYTWGQKLNTHQSVTDSPAS